MPKASCIVLYVVRVVAVPVLAAIIVHCPYVSSSLLALLLAFSLFNYFRPPLGVIRSRFRCRILCVRIEPWSM